MVSELANYNVIIYQSPALRDVQAGLPYSFAGQKTLDEITAGAPYGATTIAGGDGSRQPSENELEGARFQRRHVADIANRLFRSA